MYLPVILLSSVLFIAFATAIISLSLSNVKMANLHNKKITSMSIAEAGLNYYLWHLAHNNEDYCDGNACTGSAPYGPFTHEYKDQSGTLLGSYDLFITPPDTGSSMTIVKSVGKVAGSNTTRTVVSTIGIPSFTKYTLLVNNSELWVGSGERIDGSVFINHSGVKNEGTIAKDVSSTETTYRSAMFNQTLPGINGSGTFGGAKLFPVPPIDFNQLNVDILNIRNQTKASGAGYFDSSGSGNVGYHIILKADNYELRKVKKYSNTSYSINQELSGITYDYPAGGVIFCEDDVWVEGTINNKKVTIIAADPEASNNQKKRIIIPNLVKYTNYDGSDKIGLITQTNIFLTQNAPTDMEIDAAMIAKDGQIKINSYPYEHKNHIKVYGSMAHNTGLIWTYCYNSGCSSWSGYQSTETVIDPHNILNPPPKFPLTGSYAILSWREE